MNILLISIIMVFIVAAGIVTISTTGFFSATGDSGQDAAAGDTGPAFRLSFGPDGSDDSNTKDEVPAGGDESDTVSAPVTGAVTGGGSSGGSSGGGSSTTPETPCTLATCDALGYECGSWNDGCGGTLDCTNCGEGFTCNSYGLCIINNPPTIQEIGILDVAEGTKLEFSLIVSDVDGDNVVVSVIGGPGSILFGNVYTFDAPCKDNAGEKMEYVTLEAVDEYGASSTMTFYLNISDNRAYVSIDPPVKDVSIGDTFFVNVSIQTEEPFLGMAFGLEYDDMILNFTDASESMTFGEFLQVDDMSKPVFFGYEGRVEGFPIREGEDNGVSGKGTLVHIYFDAILEGESELNFLFTEAVKSDGGELEEICIITEGGVVNVYSV